MKLESLALWEEKELFGECSDEDKGNRGYCKYIFTPDGVAIRADNMKRECSLPIRRYSTLLIRRQIPRSPSTTAV